MSTMTEYIGISLKQIILQGQSIREKAINACIFKHFTNSNNQQSFSRKHYIEENAMAQRNATQLQPHFSTNLSVR